MYQEYQSSSLEVSTSTQSTKISLRVSTNIHCPMHLPYNSVLVSRVENSKSSLLEISTSTKSPRHLQKRSVLVPRVPVVSHRGQ